MKKIIRGRRLTAEEAANYDSIRKEIEAEKPQINDRIRRQLAQKRREHAAQSGRQTIGQQISSAREALGKSQAELSAAAEITLGYLTQLEADEREPTLSLAARLARILNISLDQMASGAA